LALLVGLAAFAYFRVSTPVAGAVLAAAALVGVFALIAAMR
jgi:hypothetical protein